MPLTVVSIRRLPHFGQRMLLRGIAAPSYLINGVLAAHTHIKTRGGEILRAMQAAVRPMGQTTHRTRCT